MLLCLYKNILTEIFFKIFLQKKFKKTFQLYVDLSTVYAGEPIHLLVAELRVCCGLQAADDPQKTRPLVARAYGDKDGPSLGQEQMMMRQIFPGVPVHTF